MAVTACWAVRPTPHTSPGCVVSGSIIPCANQVVCFKMLPPALPSRCLKTSLAAATKTQAPCPQQQTISWEVSPLAPSSAPAHAWAACWQRWQRPGLRCAGPTPTCARSLPAVPGACNCRCHNCLLQGRRSPAVPLSCVGGSRLSGIQLTREHCQLSMPLSLSIPTASHLLTPLDPWTAAGAVHCVWHPAAGQRRLQPRLWLAGGAELQVRGLAGQHKSRCSPFPVRLPCTNRGCSPAALQPCSCFLSQVHAPRSSQLAFRTLARCIGG